MFSTDPFQYRWLKRYIYSSCYYHHQIGSIHLSHCYHIFPWLCVWDDCYIIFCYLLHMHSAKTGNLFLLILCSLWWVQKSGIRFDLKIVLVYLYITPSHYHHRASLFEHIELIKCPSDIVCHQFSIIQYTALCVFSLPIPLWWLRECIYLSYHHHHQRGSMKYTHCLGLGHETKVCAVYLSVFFWVVLT